LNKVLSFSSIFGIGYMSEPGSPGNETRAKRVCRPGDVAAENGQHDNV